MCNFVVVATTQLHSNNKNNNNNKHNNNKHNNNKKIELLIIEQKCM